MDVETSKTTTCARFFFDRGGNRPYYTRPMAAGLPDLVDCARLAEEAAVLERTYELSNLPRLKELLAQPQGVIDASFAFSKLASGRPGARIEVRSAPVLICQRCMQGFAFPLEGGSDVEFADDATDVASDSERELFSARGGMVSLRELAEEELLLALPVAPACSIPLTCGNAPDLTIDAPKDSEQEQMRRPFGALQDLLKKR